MKIRLAFSPEVVTVFDRIHREDNVETVEVTLTSVDEHNKSVTATIEFVKPTKKNRN